VLFNHEGKIQKYKSPLEIMEEFADVRLKQYGVRKQYLVDKLTLERDLLSNLARFIAYIIAKKLHINNRKKMDVVKDLVKFKFQKFGDDKPPRTGFEYLLIMQIASLTKERKEELERMAKEKAAELEKVKKTSIHTMWTFDLTQLETAINSLNAALDDIASGGTGQKRKAGSREGGRGGKRSKGAEQNEEEEEEEGVDDDGTAVPDPLDNPFGDVSKWTMGALKSWTAAGAGSGKRRRVG